MSGGRVMVVDDNPVIQRMLSDLLAHAGLLVQRASDARSCRALIAANPPDVLVLDIQLPDEDGLSLARELKADPRTAAIAIVAVTSYAMKGDRERALQAGCDLYISKPIDTRTFAETIGSYCVRDGEG